MPKGSKKTGKGKAPQDSPGDKKEIPIDLSGLENRLDILINVLLEILFSNSQYQQAIPYTEKVGYLAKQGLDAGHVSKIVGRPSNWVSNRIKESKTRKKSRRRMTSKVVGKSHREGGTDAKG